MIHLINKTYTRAFMLIYVMFFSVCSIIILPTKSVSSNEIDSFQETHDVFIDKNNIKSVIIHRLGFELSDPVIELNSDEKLLISFDDLNDVLKSYTYKLQHCNSNWEASDLLKSEYLEGFSSDQINDYQFSLNTTTPYIHYELVFPTDYLRITKSGNYIISVFENDNDELPSFIRKFKVIESKVDIYASVKPPLSIKFKKNKQEIGFKIHLNNLYLPSPETSLKVIISQNHRDDNLISDLKPVRNQGSTLDYNFNNKSIFYGGNEFRPLNIKSVKYKSERIASIDYLSDGYHISLYKDLIKEGGNYIYEHDINGLKLVKTEDEEDSSTEANYCWVHFKLEAKPHLLNKNIYLIGKLTEGKSIEEIKMKYNSERNTFEGLLFLKQGYYDYQYLVKEKGVYPHNITLTEGSHYATNNEYSVFVYYREPGTLYDQLIGLEKFNGPQN